MHQILLYLQDCADLVMSKKIAEVEFECFQYKKKTFRLLIKRQKFSDDKITALPTTFSFIRLSLTGIEVFPELEVTFGLMSLQQKLVTKTVVPIFRESFFLWKLSIVFRIFKSGEGHQWVTTWRYGARIYAN